MSHGWSPLRAIADVPRSRSVPEAARRSGQWIQARTMAQWMMGAARADSLGTPRGAELAAEQMLAPLLLAAVIEDENMATVAEWIHHRNRDGVARILDRADANEAAAAWRRADPSDPGPHHVLASLIHPYDDPEVLARSEEPEISAAALLDGGANALFVIAPTPNERLRPVLAAMLSELLDGAMTRALRSPAGRLSSPLLVVVDEPMM